MDTAKSLSSYPGLMLALDIEDFGLAQTILSQNINYINSIKLGSAILTSPNAGFRIISYIKERFEIPIVIDSKLKDVPHILLSTAKSYASHGATAITCWADVGEDALSLLINEMRGHLDIIVLTALTSIKIQSQEQAAKENILMATRCGADYIQIPGNFPNLITWSQNHISKNINIVSCGVGPQGGVVGNAIKCGANHEIIGRKLLDHENFEEIKKSFRETHKIIQNALNFGR